MHLKKSDNFGVHIIFRHSPYFTGGAQARQKACRYIFFIVFVLFRRILYQGFFPSLKSFSNAAISQFSVYKKPPAAVFFYLYFFIFR